MTGGPALPDGVDPHLQAFVACQRDQVELVAGTVTWMPLPPGVPRFLGKPKAHFMPDGDGVRATVKWGFASIGLRASIDDDGHLVAQTTGFAFGLEAAIGRWVDAMNEQLEANGRRLERIMLVGDNVVIVKRHVTADAEASPQGNTAPR